MPIKEYGSAPRALAAVVQAITESAGNRETDKLIKEVGDMSLQSAANGTDFYNASVSLFDSRMAALATLEREAKSLKLDNSGVDFSALSLQHANVASRDAYLLAKAYEEGKSNVFAVNPSAGQVVMSSGSRTALSSNISLQSFGNYDAHVQSRYGTAMVLTGSGISPAVELFFKEIFVSMQDLGFSLRNEVLATVATAYHSLGSSLYDQRRSAIVRAYREPALLEDNSTKIVPDGSNASTEPLLVSATDFPNSQVKLGSEVVTTRPYRTDVAINILGNAYKPTLSGSWNDEDQVAQGAKVASVVTGDDDNKLEFVMGGARVAEFMPQASSDVAEVMLNCKTSFTITKDFVQRDGKPLAGALAVIATTDLKIVVEIRLTGALGLETGNLDPVQGTLTVVRAFNASNSELSLNDTAVKAVVTALNAMGVKGFTLDANRTNANFRTQGQLVQTNTYQQLYVAQPHAPITMKLSVSNSSDVDNINNVLSVRGPLMTKAGLTRILDLENELSQTRAAGIFNLRASYDSYGFAAIYVDPTLVTAELNLNDGTVTSQETSRFDNACSRICNMITHVATRMAIDSRYLDFGRFVTKQKQFTPKLAILSDQYHSQFIKRSGEPQIVPQMTSQVAVVSDKRFDNTIYMSFVGGDGTGDDKATPSIIDFGWLVNTTPVVLTVERDINGGRSRHLVYIPVYNFYVNLPILGKITVKGAADFIGLGGAFPVHVEGHLNTTTTP